MQLLFEKSEKRMQVKKRNEKRGLAYRNKEKTTKRICASSRSTVSINEYSHKKVAGDDIGY